MTTHFDATPLLDAGDSAMRRSLAISMDAYGERFVDAAFWRPYIERICHRHGMDARTIASGQPGTFPTFIVNRTHVVKLFGEPFDGPHCWRTEIAVGSVLSGLASTIPVARVIGSGVLSQEPAWQYIVFDVLEGAPYDSVRERLTVRQRGDVARQLGRMLRVLHDLDGRHDPVLRWSWHDWTAFVARQLPGLTERHRRWGRLPAHLIGQVDAYVAAYRADPAMRPALIHADLHQDHLFGAFDGDGSWQATGVIDWGDARIGDRFYELPALHLGLFHGDTAMLAAFLASYGWEGHRSDAFVQRAMAMTLLHEFDVLDGVPMPDDVESIADLADRIWRV